MISIVNNFNTTITISQMMNYGLIIIIFLILIFFLRNIIGETAHKTPQIRTLADNLNLISVPLLLMFISLIFIYYLKNI